MKYTLTFSKGGYLRFISHLDLMRLFKRAFKRSQISLKFSEGFNPHPKMTFAQPLSLGYSSTCEILDIETREDYFSKEIMDKLNEILPHDIRVLECVHREDEYKGVSATITSAKYMIEIPHVEMQQNEIDEFLNQKEIIAFKKQKKKKELKKVDIKPQIIGIEIMEADKPNIEMVHRFYDKSSFILAEMHCGSSSNLNPDILLNAMEKFGIFGGNESIRDEIEITRVHIE